MQASQPVNHYFDITVTNNNVDNTPEPIQFTESRLTDLLKEPQNYFFTVDRFFLNTTQLPYFIPDIQLGQSDIDLTQYYITMSYDGAFFQYQCEFIPQNLSTRLPYAPLTNQDVSNNRYYEVNSLDWVCHIFNTNLKTCFDQLAILKPAINTNTPPFFRVNSDGSIDFLAEDIYSQSTTEASRIKVYFNTVLYQLFCVLNFVDYGVNVTSPYSLADKLAIWISALKKETISSKTYNVMSSQSQDITQIWNPIQTIEFQTSLPILFTAKSRELPYGSITSLSNTSSSNANSTILTNFIADNSDYRPTLLYEPASEYRWFDFVSQKPINQITISIFWTDKWNNSHQLYLPSKGIATLKLLFRQKTAFLTS